MLILICEFKNENHFLVLVALAKTIFCLRLFSINVSLAVQNKYHLSVRVCLLYTMILYATSSSLQWFTTNQIELILVH